uniref:Uncharacterized protein n=1 Tax=Spermophilus dauricus TaxID=99837 RepID=A0A8C9UMW7_SPEDA
PDFIEAVNVILDISWNHEAVYGMHSAITVIICRDDTMTGDGGEYLRPEDLKELGDDSLPSSQFLDGMNYLRYSLEGGRSDRYSRKT